MILDRFIKEQSLFGNYWKETHKWKASKLHRNANRGLSAMWTVDCPQEKILPPTRFCVVLVGPTQSMVDCPPWSSRTVRWSDFYPDQARPKGYCAHIPSRKTQVLSFSLTVGSKGRRRNENQDFGGFLEHSAKFLRHSSSSSTMSSRYFNVSLSELVGFQV